MFFSFPYKFRISLAVFAESLRAFWFGLCCVYFLVNDSFMLDLPSRSPAALLGLSLLPAPSRGFQGRGLEHPFSLLLRIFMVFDAIIRHCFFLFNFVFSCLMLLCINTVDFCALTLSQTLLPNALISFTGFCCVLRIFYVNNMSPINRDSFMSFFFQMVSLLFLVLAFLHCGISSTTLVSSSLFLILRRNCFVFHH